MNETLTDVARLIGMPEAAAERIVPLRPGARTRAVLASPEGVEHRLATRASRVVVKLYKGDGSSASAGRYREYHDNWFPRLDALTANPLVQQSLEAGRSPGLGPYAVLQYVVGEELAPVLDERRLPPETARTVLQDVLEGVWIPLWAAGLRFKDCHPGNFVLTPEGRAVMIDTEQMRKGVEEQLQRPGERTAREAHERQGLRRLSRLVQRIVLATNPTRRAAPIKRTVDAAIAEHGLLDRLGALGWAGENARTEAEAGACAFLETLAGAGVLH